MDSDSIWGELITFFVFLVFHEVPWISWISSTRSLASRCSRVRCLLTWDDVFLEEWLRRKRNGFRVEFGVHRWLDSALRQFLGLKKP